MRACERHPAILCYAIGNEIPAPIVRWHGKRPVERFLERLYREAKLADPEGLVTYVNYPTTEYLELPFLDLAAFNVFLERERTFESYLARLQNLSGDRPLLITELGLDSRRNGGETQAQVLDWQVRHAFAAGAAGTFVFAWTDEWHRGGHEVERLGLRARRPRAAAEAGAGGGRPRLRRRALRGRVAPGPRSRWSSAPTTARRTLGECLARLADAQLPRLRGDRRRRRLQRRPARRSPAPMARS